MNFYCVIPAKKIKYSALNNQTGNIAFSCFYIKKKCYERVDAFFFFQKTDNIKKKKNY